VGYYLLRVIEETCGWNGSPDRRSSTEGMALHRVSSGRWCAA